VSATGGSRRQPLSLRGKALALLAQRDHSRVELRRKLLAYLGRRERSERAEAARWQRSHEHDAAAIRSADTDEVPDVDPAVRLREVDDLLDWLQAHRYLDDARFVESRTHARASRYGAMRIVAELRQLGVEADEDTRSRLRDSEEARARSVWSRRFGDHPAQDAREQARQMRFLAQRGFAPGVIRRVVARAGSALDDGDDAGDSA